MHDILIALAFVGMVSAPAVIAAFPGKEKDLEVKNEASGFNALTLALANAKKAIPVTAGTAAAANR